jgi:hypothetical protein
MKIKSFLILMALVVVGGCKNTVEKTASINNEIETLTTPELQRQFLEKIHNLDQKVRKEETSILQQYGFNSEEHQKAIQGVMETDAENLQKIERYLDQYGHPKKDVHGEMATNAPWLVVHHASGISPRFRNFKYIYMAYRNNDISDNAISFYLNRMYAIQFGNRIEWEGAFTIEQEIDTLIKALDLMDIVDEVED